MTTESNTQESPKSSSPDVEAAVAAMTDEQRLNLFHRYCVYCGTPNPRCYCCRDD